MRKNIKILIISLSILAVTSTVTAITVPLLMHANNVDNENSNREITITEAKLVTSNKEIQSILKGNSESEMLDIVKSINGRTNGWSGAFKLTNENDKTVNNVIKEVDLAVTRGLIANDKQAINFTFLITYNDGIKFNGKSSLIRHELQKNIITSLELVPDNVTRFTSLVNRDLAEIKDSGLQAWLNKQIIREEIAKLLIAKQGATNVPVHFANSEDITTEGSLRYKIRITPAFDAINEEDSYFLAQDIVLPQIGLEKIELALEDSAEAANKKIAAAKVLIDELNFAATIAEQKEVYDSWKIETPFAFKEALNNLLTVTGKGYSWTDILKEIKISTGTFPATAGLPVPDVSVEIILKDDFSANAATAGLLKFNITGLGFSTKQVSISKSSSFDTIVGSVKTKLEDLLKTQVSIGAEKALYDSWGNTTPNEIKYGLKDSLIFDGGVTTWDSTVIDIIVKPGTYPSTNNADIPPLAITIVLKDGVKASAGKEFLNFNINLGKSSYKLTATKADTYDAKLNEATTVLSNALANATTLSAQKALYEEWATKTPAGFANILKGIVKFDGTVTWDNVVTGISIIPGAFPSAINVDIPPVEIKINLNKDYIVSNPELLTLTSGALGKTKTTTETVVVNADDHATKLAAATLVLRTALDKANTVDAQKIVYDGWSTNVPAEFVTALIDIVKFDGGITWDTAVKDVTLTPRSFPTAVGQAIPKVGITINLNTGYTATDGSKKYLTFDSGDLGLAVPINTITVSEVDATKLNAATLVLRKALDGAKTLAAQKIVYDGWSTNVPGDFETALIDIVKFDGGITWGTAVKDVTLTPRSFPTAVGQAIPKVGITINLNTGYTATDGSKKYLTFDSGDLGLAVPINTITVSEVDATKLNAATLVLRKALDGAKTLAAQKIVYDGWSTNVPKDFVTALENIVTFDGGITWGTAFESVTLVPGSFPSAGGEKIPSVKINIKLKADYTATTESKSKLTFDSGELGITKRKLTIVTREDVNYDTKLAAATQVLIDHLNTGNTPTEQKNLYNNLENINPPGFVETLKGIVKFDADDANWDNIFQDVKIEKLGNISDFPGNAAIPSVRITIILKSEYEPSPDTKDLLTFDSGKLGLTKEIKTTITKATDFDTKLDAATQVLRNLLDEKATIADKKALYDGWGRANSAPKSFVDALIDIITFGTGDAYIWGLVVSRVSIVTGTFDETPGAEIPKVTIKIEQDTGYKPFNKDSADLLTLVSGGLGLNTKVTPFVENTVDILIEESKKR